MFDYFSFELSTGIETAEIATPVRIINPADAGVEIKHAMAIWDTGATSSMISARIAKALKLPVQEKTRIAGVHGIEDANVYRVNIGFGTGFCLNSVRVSESASDAGFDILIGMDIISRGLLIVSGMDKENLRVFFQIPSENSLS